MMFAIPQKMLDKKFNECIVMQVVSSFINCNITTLMVREDVMKTEPPSHFVGDGELFLSRRSEYSYPHAYNVLIKIEDKWFSASKASKPKDSMIEALEGFFPGGITVREMVSTLEGLGLTLSDCASDNLIATLDKLKKCLEYEERNAKKFGHTYQQTLDSVAKLKTTTEATNGSSEVIRILEEMQKTLSAYPIIE
jgi:hypothetical protein